MTTSVLYHEIVSLIGEEKALELSIKAGGSDIFIPRPGRIGSSSIIVELVGADAASALAAIYGGESIWVSNGPGKRAKMWALREAGWTHNAIAREVNCTARTVYSTFAKTRRPSVLPAVPPPPPGGRQKSREHKAERRAKIWGLHEAGLSVNAIARHLGYSASLVYRVIREAHRPSTLPDMPRPHNAMQNSPQSADEHQAGKMAAALTPVAATGGADLVTSAPPPPPHMPLDPSLTAG